MTVYRNSSSGGGSEGGSDRDTVYIRSIDDQVLSRGSERIINVRTDASAIDVSTSNSSVVKVSSRRDDTIVLETGSDRTKIRFRRTAIANVEKLDMGGKDTTPAKK